MTINALNDKIKLLNKRGEIMIIEFKGKKPEIDKDTYISQSVDIAGDVKISKECNIWFGSRLRGDMNSIEIGEKTNIQENSVVHVDSESGVKIGNGVTIGHGAIIHGCEIEDNVLIGMGSIILNNAKISKNSIVGAGTLITGGKVFEEGVLIIGNPGKAIRKLKEEEINSIRESAKHYVELSKEYKKTKKD